MKFSYVLFKTIKKNIKDYGIYFISLFFLNLLLFVSYLLSYAVKEMQSSMISNSLPAIMFITMLFLQAYINRFMIIQRSKEFAIYLLCGVNKNQIAFLYIMQVGAVSLAALFPSILFGYIFFDVTNKTIFDNYFVYSIKEMFCIPLINTMGIYILIQIIVFAYTIRMISKVTILRLIEKKKENENPVKYKKIKFYLFLFATGFILFLYDIFNLESVVAVGSIFLSIVIVLYSGYIILFSFLQRSRDLRKGWIGRRGSWLYIAAELLSKQRILRNYSLIISLCVMISLVSYIVGAIFIKGNNILISSRIDSLMGTIQIFISLLFLIVIYTLIAIRQLTEAINNDKKKKILKNLGKSNSELKRLILFELIVNFTFPFVLFMLMLFIALPILNIKFYEFNILKLEVQFAGVFTFLYLCYLIITYWGLTRRDEV